jgi:hypothetical protein
MTDPADTVISTRPVGPAAIYDILWNSAWESLVSAFLVTLLGSIALGIVGDLWKEMSPSMPPGFSHQKTPEAETEPSPNPTHLHLPGFIQEHRFPIVYCVIFITTAGVRLRDLFRGELAPGRKSRLGKIARRLSEDWFGLIVGNAFGAMVSAMIFVWVTQFSWVQFLIHHLLGAILPSLRDVVSWILGQRAGNWVGSWLDWYSDNQLRFTFWLLYLGSICDDLGVPNLKSLCRWLWRRRKAKQALAQKATLAAADPNG